MSDKMPRIFMPDPEKMPDGLTFSPGLVQQYKTLPAMYVSSWAAFGDGTTLAAPKTVPVGKVSGAENAGIANYQQWVIALQHAYDRLLELDATVVKAADDSPELCHEGRSDLANGIDGLKVMASVDPRDVTVLKELIDKQVLDPSLAQGGNAISEDDYVMAIIDSAVNTVSGIMQEKSQQFAEIGSKVRKQNPEDAGKTTGPGGVDKPSPSGKNTGPSNTFTYTGDNSPYSVVGNENSPAAAPVWNWDTAGSPSLSSLAPVTDSSVAQTTASNDAGQPMPLVASAEPSSRHSLAPAAAAPASAAASAPYGMPAYALPMALAAANQRRAAEAARSVPATAENPSSTVIAPAVGAPPAAPAQAAPSRAGAGPASANTASNSAANAANSAPGASNQSATPTQAAAPAKAGATPVSVAVARADDGSTVFTFPDGRSQRVSIVVSNALTAAFGNAATTDGRGAYAATPAKIPDANSLGTPAEPNQLTTGDLASWDTQRTALVVAFPEENGGTLEVIIEAQLRPFDPHMSDKSGDFGSFAGFFHPAGIDISAPSSSPGLSATPVDQSTHGPATVPA
ncbi:hypothetical protein ACIBQ0_15845 [Nocardia nova]|uniref:hypothetical protein n=1 Tax=Nocardia nova TaxID=37330 RepID=UPI0037BDBD04